MSDHGQHYSEGSSTSSTSQLILSPNIQSGNWSERVPTNTRLRSLPVGLSSPNHDQHYHYQESEKDREEVEQCVQKGEEDIGDVNATDSWAEEQEVLVSTSSHYLVQSFVGEGSFGEVATCLNMDTKQTVAVKILKKTDDNIVCAEEEVNIIQPFDV